MRGGGGGRGERGWGERGAESGGEGGSEGRIQEMKRYIRRDMRNKAEGIYFMDSNIESLRAPLSGNRMKYATD